MLLIRKIGFTLVELVIAISISALVLIVIFYVVSDTVVQLAETTKQSEFLEDFSSFSEKMNSHVNTFPNSQIFINQTTDTGHDVLLFNNFDSSDTVIWGVVDTDTYRLVTNSNYNLYKDAVLGYRSISSTELSDLNATPTNVYSYNFFEDKTFPNFRIKTFQAEYFQGTGAISLDLDIITSYKQDLEGQAWSGLPIDDLFEVNLIF